jgi:hypothetical protein
LGSDFWDIQDTFKRGHYLWSRHSHEDRRTQSIAEFVKNTLSKTTLLQKVVNTIKKIAI